MSIYKYAKCGAVATLLRIARKNLAETLLTISAEELINIPEKEMEILRKAETIMKNLENEFNRRYMM